MRDRILDDLLGAPEQTEVPFDSLMPRRVNKLLLVTSLYDSYTFMEDGRLSEMFLGEFRGLNLQHSPQIQRVSTAQEALEAIQREPFDLVISMPRVGAMNVREFGAAVQERAPDLPVILLASSLRELNQLGPMQDLKGIREVFVWLGDVGLFLAMIKCVEDRMNIRHDARLAGVKGILVVEDNVPFYSANLPVLYTEIMNQTVAIMADGVNQTQRIIRRRARPKILLAHTFEEAMELLRAVRRGPGGADPGHGVPPERPGRPGGGPGLRPPRGGAHPGPAHPGPVPVRGLGGRGRAPGDLPAQGRPGPAGGAAGLPAGAPGIRRVPVPASRRPVRVQGRRPAQPGVGHPGGPGRVPGLPRPAGGLLPVAAGPDRTPPGRDPGPDRRLRAGRGRAAPADPGRPVGAPGGDPGRRGGGILPGGLRGGQPVRAGGHRLPGREGPRPGLHQFAAHLATAWRAASRASASACRPPWCWPPACSTASWRANGLTAFALRETDDDKITRAFLAADLPRDVVDALWTFLDWVRYPLAVRSSSLLEDASYQPFAGIYETYMIPNNAEDPEVRLAQLGDAIKMVYASTYHADAKAYLQSTPNRLEEEKMAVVIQQVAGRRHGRYLYPDFAGVGRSLNFYPMPGMKPEEGIGSVALGLGKTVVDGGRCARFCPAQPAKPLQWFAPEDYLENAQREFFALDLEGRRRRPGLGRRHAQPGHPGPARRGRAPAPCIRWAASTPRTTTPSTTASAAPACPW